MRTHPYLLNLLNHIQLAYKARRLSFNIVLAPCSFPLLRKFYKLGIVSSFKTVQVQGHRHLIKIQLNYFRLGASLGGAFHYAFSHTHLTLSYGDLTRWGRWPKGVLLLQTDKGLLTDAECRQKKVGGRLICQLLLLHAL